MESEIKRLTSLLLNSKDVSAVAIKVQKEQLILSNKVQRSLSLSIKGLLKAVDELSSVQNIHFPSVPLQVTKLDAACEDCNVLDQNFLLIERVFGTGKRLADIEAYYQRMKVVSSDMQRLFQLFQQDLAQEFMRADNLLLVYFYIVKVEDFQLELLHGIRNPNAQLYLEEFFATFNKVKKRVFPEYLMELSQFLFDFVSEQQFDLITWIMQIIQLEEQRDSESISTRQALDSSKEATRLEVLPVAWRANKEIRNLKRIFFNTLKKTIEERFSAVIGELKNDLEATLESLKTFVIPDLMIVSRIFTLLFPEEWNIFEFCLLQYHGNVYSTTVEFTKDELNPTDILLLLRWSQEYYDRLKEELFVFKDHLDPPLLDKKETEFIKKFISQSQSKLQEWITNLGKLVKSNFIARTESPRLDAQGKFFSPASTDLFAIIRQNVDSAAKSSRGRLLNEMIQIVSQAVGPFQKGIIQMILEENKKYFQNPDSVAQGLDVYLAMIGNASLKWVELNDELKEMLCKYAEEEYKNSIAGQMKAMHDGFLQITKVVNSSLVDLILFTIAPASNLLFTANWMHVEEALMANIVATFQDYFDNTCAFFEEFLFSKLQTELLERFTLLYIDKMRHKNSAFKVPECTEMLKSDYGLLLDFFSEYKGAARSEHALDPIAKLISLLTCGKKLAFADFYTLWRAYPDVPMWFVETVLKRRSDMDSSTLKETMEACNSRVKVEAQSVSMPPSLFSRLKK